MIDGFEESYLDPVLFHKKVSGMRKYVLPGVPSLAFIISEMSTDFEYCHIDSPSSSVFYNQSEILPAASEGSGSPSITNPASPFL
jgi:hypothetical protein